MYKNIPTDIQAKALHEALTLSNVKAIASKYNISEDIIYRKYNILRHLLPFLVWLTPKKNTRCHRILSQIKISLFLSLLRFYAYLQKRKANSCKLGQKTSQKIHSNFE